jgi:hypothetical protein
MPVVGESKNYGERLQAARLQLVSPGLSSSAARSWASTTPLLARARTAMGCGWSSRDRRSRRDQLFLWGGGLEYRSSLDEPHDRDDQGDDQQQVDQSAADVHREAESPQDYQDQDYGPQHDKVSFPNDSG